MYTTTPSAWDVWENLSDIMNGFAKYGNGHHEPKAEKETRPRNVTVNFFVRIN